MENKTVDTLGHLFKDIGAMGFILVILALILIVSAPTILMIIRDKIRSKNSGDIMLEFNSNLAQFVSKMDILIDQYNDSVSGPIAEILLKNIFQNNEIRMRLFIIDVIENNDLQNNRISIEHKIRMNMETTFRELQNTINKFKYKTRPLGEFVKINYQNSMSDVILKTIYDANLRTPARKQNITLYLQSEFDNLLFLSMNNINKY